MKKVKMVLVLGLMCMLFRGTVYAKEAILSGEIVDTTEHIYTYTEMENDIFKLTQKYPEYISSVPIGISYDARHIWEVIIGNPQAPHAIYIQASIHAREWMNTWMLMKQIEEILKSWDTPIAEGVKIGDIFEQCAVYILPMVNPDGVTISEMGIEGIRNEVLRMNLYQMQGASNPTRWKANAVGVDLNRNFSVGWGNTINVHTPASQCFNGIAPFTEPEVWAVVAAFQQRKFDVAISYHSMEGAIYWNIGQQGELLEKSVELAALVNQITGYTLGKQSVVHGLDYNWMIFDKNTPTVVIETGTVACPLPYSQWQELWLRNKDLITLLAMNYAYR